MTDLVKKKPYVRRTSGDHHPVLKCYREKLESIEDGQLPALEKLNKEIEKLKNEDEQEQACLRPEAPDAPKDECLEVEESDILAVDSDPFPPIDKGADSRQPAAYSQQPAAGSRQQESRTARQPDSPQPAAGSQQPTADSKKRKS